MAVITRPNPDASSPSPASDGDGDQPGMLVDTHVHFHRQHEPAKVLHHAAEHFERHQQAGGVNSPWRGCLMLTEPAGEARFARFRDGKETVPGWDVRPMEEASSLRFQRADGVALTVTAGRQIVTAEGLEVLGLGVDDSIEDGQAIDAAIEQVRAARGVAVIPWGFGKWTGRRRRLVSRAVAEHEDVWLGDNGGRWRWLGWPRETRQQAQDQDRVLAGSDPLPLTQEAAKAGRYATLIPGKVDPARPFASFRVGLQCRAGDLCHVGELERLGRFVRAQWAMQRGGR